MAPTPGLVEGTAVLIALIVAACGIAETVEEAALLAEGAPIEAWSYGGPPSSGSS